MRHCGLIMVWFLVLLIPGTGLAQPVIPLPEHPRPDFERPLWQNLNGTWQFRFDAEDEGVNAAWHTHTAGFDQTIMVPFSWGAPLSGVADEADIGWYARTIRIPSSWVGKRTFLHIGASDWHTRVWIDGEEVGTHQGGYTPFAFELTTWVEPEKDHLLVIRVDDTPHPFKLFGKQGYGPARGIWQTPYLEATGSYPASLVHVTPDIDQGKATIKLGLLDEGDNPLAYEVEFITGGLQTVTGQIPAGQSEYELTVDIPNARLWTLSDPFLYEIAVRIGKGEWTDSVHTYFGMRKISIMDMPGSDYPYIALNNEPIYIQASLDQAYHPEGYYTFPSDAFMRDEILRARQIGLNTQRIHVKIGIPRKLYWADKLGMLIMADVPNSWGEPDAAMRQEVEYALEQMIRRDYNHPSIFSWVPFNETWGLFTTLADGKRDYLPETQEWVVSVYQKAKALDPTRLVEDNSPCCGRGHTVTDINSWHSYLPGYAWEEHLQEIVSQTYPGSTHNYEVGYQQGRVPNINSEFGNVWGYKGSTGDVDWSWDYHLAINAFRKQPKIAGWLYTEHHDVVNEWNGYWRYDRSEKFTGMEDLVEGMSLRDLHAPFYIATGGDLSRSAEAGSLVDVPLSTSFMTGESSHGSTLELHAHFYGWDALGNKVSYYSQSMDVPFEPWLHTALTPLSLHMPDEESVAVLALVLTSQTGQVLGRNFTTFVVSSNAPLQVAPTELDRITVPAGEYAAASWSVKQWEVLEGKKVNGTGGGFFEYRLPWSGAEDVSGIIASFYIEASAKQLFGKDRDDADEMGGDYMRGRGTHDPSRNPNAYPMTDEDRYPSAVRVQVNGVDAGRFELADDPADHRGILSWHSQLRDGLLREAGSYGERIVVALPPAAIAKAADEGAFIVRLTVDDALPGGLAIYGKSFGRYALDPTILIEARK